MPIIRVEDKYRLTLPAELREGSGLAVGDIFEAKWENGKITLTPQTIVDRIPKALKDVRAQARREGLDKITMVEIDAEIAAVRASQRAKESPNDRSSS